MDNKDMPAMPVRSNNTYGLTKREHFAGLAMVGLLSNSGHPRTGEEIISMSIEAADALLSALENK